MTQAFKIVKDSEIKKLTGYGFEIESVEKGKVVLDVNGNNFKIVRFMPDAIQDQIVRLHLDKNERDKRTVFFDGAVYAVPMEDLEHVII